MTQPKSRRLVTEAQLDDPNSPAVASLNSRYDMRGEWTQQLIDAQAQLAPPINTPAVTYSAGNATALSSPVEYRPAACGTGVGIPVWDGRTGPTENNFLFHPGVFETANGAASDLCLNGGVKPNAGGGYRWPIIVEFNTAATVSQVEVAFYGTPDIAFRLEVNGLPAIADATVKGTTGLGNGKKMLLTFPTAAARRIRLYFDGGIGFQAVRVPTGQSITKPTGTARVGAIIGDSYLNGAGAVNDYPSGAGIFDTFALRVLKALGCNQFILAGVGGTGLTTAAATNYASRVSAVLAMSPNVLIVNGSINDGSGAGTIEAALTSFLSSTSTVPERYVIGTMKSNYDANHAAVKAAADAAGVPFIDMLRFIYGSGKITAPTGDGNADVFVIADGVHPSYPAHIAIANRVITEAIRLRDAT